MTSNEWASTAADCVLARMNDMKKVREETKKNIADIRNTLIDQEAHLHVLNGELEKLGDAVLKLMAFSPSNSPQVTAR